MTAKTSRLLAATAPISSLLHSPYLTKSRRDYHKERRKTSAEAQAYVTEASTHFHGDSHSLRSRSIGPQRHYQSLFHSDGGAITLALSLVNACDLFKSNRGAEGFDQEVCGGEVGEVQRLLRHGKRQSQTGELNGTVRVRGPQARGCLEWRGERKGGGRGSGNGLHDQRGHRLAVLLPIVEEVQQQLALQEEQLCTN
eukprot:scaffold1491_cov167-Ochromonas_danica.AAC.5